MHLLYLVLKKVRSWNFIKNPLSEDLLKLSKNIIFSGSSQLVTLASPLLITPYLIRVLGIDLFGLIVMAQSVMMYLSYLVDYSFNIDATQEASIKRDDPVELTKLFNNVTWTRIFLLTISGFLLLAFIYAVPNITKYKVLFLISFTITIGRTVIPQWVLIGTEHMKEMAIVNTISKVAVYIAVFMFIKTPKDFLFVNFIWGLGDVILGPFLILFLNRKLKIELFSLPSFVAIKKRLINGWPLFLSNSMNALNIYSNITILSLFSNPHLIGSFAVAEKIMMLIKQIAGIIFQATYPYACKLKESSNNQLKNFLKNETYIFATLFSLIGLFVVVMANNIVFFFVGRFDGYAINLLRGLAFVPLIVSLNMSASQIMLINGLLNRYARIIIFIGILNVVANFILAPIFGPSGTVVAIIITELINTVSLHLTLFIYYPSLQIFNMNRLLTSAK
ncbi:oligosaccharide flippase family protein [Spirosoma gilvum]